MTDTFNKEEYVEKLCDAIIDSMDRKDLERVVWDQLFEEMISQDWVDLRMQGDDYGVEAESLGKRLTVPRRAVCPLSPAAKMSYA